MGLEFSKGLCYKDLSNLLDFLGFDRNVRFLVPTLNFETPCPVSTTGDKKQVIICSFLLLTWADNVIFLYKPKHSKGTEMRFSKFKAFWQKKTKKVGMMIF
jgi:hypothetical protein